MAQPLTAVAKQQDKGVATWQASGGEVKLSAALIQRYFCPAATEQEAMVFLALCKYQGLNPWLRDAYLIKYGGSMPASMVVGKDTFTKRANHHPQFDGFEAGVVLMDTDGLMERRDGSLVRQGEEIVGGWARVHRKDRTHPVYAEVSFEEYAGRTKDGQLTRSWKSIPATMIRKVALVQALRESFPDELSGLYDAAEMKVEPSELPEMPLKQDHEAAPLPPLPPEGGVIGMGEGEPQRGSAGVVERLRGKGDLSPAMIASLDRAQAKGQHDTADVREWLKARYGYSAPQDVRKVDYEAILLRLSNPAPLAEELAPPPPDDGAAG